MIYLLTTFYGRHDIQLNDTWQNDIQHNGTQYCYAECRKYAHYAECHNAKCRYAECHGALLCSVFGKKIIKMV